MLATSHSMSAPTVGMMQELPAKAENALERGAEVGHQARTNYKSRNSFAVRPSSIICIMMLACSPAVQAEQTEHITTPKHSPKYTKTYELLSTHTTPAQPHHKTNDAMQQTNERTNERTNQPTNHNNNNRAKGPRQPIKTRSQNSATPTRGPTHS